ncbi:hypothetical protein [Exiguobacterium sp. s21]|uniref:hypothetical protein n=1 Tax=Exiguobacterium sp. s21 TaxID=2751244 RepID=UPI001BEA5F43|nr:hypothetical protein [Exiguobacterium sp. s21]
MRARTIIIMETIILEEDRELARAVHNNKRMIDEAKTNILDAAEELFGEDGMTIRVETDLIEDEK